MALEMKSQCEKCDTALPDESDAYICSFECTFCPPAPIVCRSSVQIVAENFCAGPDARPSRIGS